MMYATGKGAGQADFLPVVVIALLWGCAGYRGAAAWVRAGPGGRRRGLSAPWWSPGGAEMTMRARSGRVGLVGSGGVGRGGEGAAERVPVVMAWRGGSRRGGEGAAERVLVVTNRGCCDHSDTLVSRIPVAWSGPWVEEPRALSALAGCVPFIGRKRCWAASPLLWRPNMTLGVKLLIERRTPRSSPLRWPDAPASTIR